MGLTCKICKSRDKKGLFTFPTKPSAIQNWKLAAKMSDSDVITSASRLCFRHFSNENIEVVVEVQYHLKDKGKNKKDDDELPTFMASNSEEFPWNQFTKCIICENVNFLEGFRDPLQNGTLKIFLSLKFVLKPAFLPF